MIITSWFDISQVESLIQSSLEFFKILFKYYYTQTFFFIKQGVKKDNITSYRCCIVMTEKSDKNVGMLKSQSDNVICPNILKKNSYKLSFIHFIASQANM